MQSSLFDEIKRSDGAPAKHAEDSFSFLNRADGIVWQRIRDKLNDWYAALPDNDESVRRRFRKADPRQHYAAWWELYVHALLRALGFDVTVHPDVPGTDGHPDFLAERGEQSFYVEAVTVFSGIVAAGRRARLEAEVQDAIETIQPGKIMLGLDFEQVGESKPKRKAITQPIEAWIAKLDADAILADGGIVSEKTRIEIGGGWVLALRSMAIPLNRRGCPDYRMIAMGPSMGGFTNDVQQLERTLTRKKKQFGTPDKPLVVAALTVNGFVGGHVVEDALFGSEAVRINVETRQTAMTRQPNGAWIGRRGAAAKRMSAALIGVGILPHTIATAWPTLWHHFDPTYELEADLPFSTSIVVDDRLEVSEATRSPAEVFNLPADWPGPEPAFPRCLHRPEDHRRVD
jgi:hypothetical protein